MIGNGLITALLLSQRNFKDWQLVPCFSLHLAKYKWDCRCNCGRGQLYHLLQMRFPLKIATSTEPQMWFIIITFGSLAVLGYLFIMECQLSINRITPGASTLRIAVPTDLQMWFVLLELVTAVSDYMVIWNASLIKIEWDSNNNACKEKIDFLITWDSWKYSVSKFERFKSS